MGVDNFSDYYPVDLKKRNQADLEAKGIVVHTLDLRTTDLGTLFNLDFDVVIHFAAQPGISASSSFDDYLTNNFIATQRMLTAIEKLDRKPYFINIATSSIYGLNATMTEDEAPLPASWYGVTKLAAEQLVLAYVRRGLLEGCSLRLYSVYGPRERPDKLYTRLIAAGLADGVFTLYEGSETHLRSFTYVSDIVDGVVAVLDRKEACSGEVFNLGTETESTTAEGIATVEAILGHSIQKTVLPPRPGDQSRTCANIDKARRILDYNPTTTLREGLEKQVEWYRKNFL
jgi:nucleoside-diphosphate-sugar epimerase